MTKMLLKVLKLKAEGATLNPLISCLSSQKDLKFFDNYNLLAQHSVRIKNNLSTWEAEAGGSL